MAPVVTPQQLPLNSYPLMPTLAIPQNSRVSAGRRMMRTSMLPGISEYSPMGGPASPTISGTLSAKQLRRQSISSILTDGTIEVEGFGYEDDENWDMESLAGNSLYEGSTYDGYGGENDDGRVTPSTLSRRAERVLQNAKKKLDLCGQNLTRARHSLVVSPPTSALSKYSDSDSLSSPISLQSAVATVGALNRLNNSAHLRTVSESALTSVYSTAHRRKIGGLGTIRDEDYREPELTRSKSALQMRALRDQMQDLRGKIANLQQQTRSDSLKRRSTSLNSLRSTPSPSLYNQDRNRNMSIGQIRYEQAGEDDYDDTATESLYSDSRSGTPRPNHRESRHEDREDAFSYDTLFLGNGIYAPSSAPGHSRNISNADSHDSRQSVSSDATEVASRRRSPTAQKEPALRRRDSVVSISSYATADEVGNYGSISSRASPSSNRSSPSSAVQLSAPYLRFQHGVPQHIGDDGYHSAPNTPGGGLNVKEPNGIHISMNTASPLNPLSNSRAGNESSLQVPRSSNPRRSSAIITTDNELLLSAPIGDGSESIALKLGEKDRLLVERLIEEMGKLCCAMEVARDQAEVGRYRAKLEMALRILQE